MRGLQEQLQDQVGAGRKGVDPGIQRRTLVEQGRRLGHLGVGQRAPVRPQAERGDEGPGLARQIGGGVRGHQLGQSRGVAGDPLGQLDGRLLQVGAPGLGDEQRLDVVVEPHDRVSTDTGLDVFDVGELQQGLDRVGPLRVAQPCHACGGDQNGRGRCGGDADSAPAPNPPRPDRTAHSGPTAPGSGSRSRRRGGPGTGDRPRAVGSDVSPRPRAARV